MPATPPDPALSAAREDKIKVAMIGLCGCWGCTLSFLDMDERIIPLLTKVTIHRSSLTDIKRITERCAIGFIEGGVANEDNIETLRHFRDNCDVLISVGACAVWGGVPAMRNVFELKDCLSEAYINSPTAVPGCRTRHPLPPGYPPDHHQGLPLPRSGQDGLLHPRLSTGRGCHLRGARRSDTWSPGRAAPLAESLRLIPEAS